MLSWTYWLHNLNQNQLTFLAYLKAEDIGQTSISNIHKHEEDNIQLLLYWLMLKKRSISHTSSSRDIPLHHELLIEKQSHFKYLMLPFIPVMSFRLNQDLDLV